MEKPNMGKTQVGDRITLPETEGSMEGVYLTFGQVENQS